eukprot:TRINITY_DN13596_c0_g1_i1.p1 TRINITY_DN13596_c0_g1~~TRINITY_DN13596_c0_g1_i1.p1  ORF type:complete len:512 (-),score=57.15 TRINITY_DN13596_c0_g1_i1:474-2009(-)
MAANINDAQTPAFLQELIKFMKVMDWMTRNHGIRFLTENVWDKVPPSWRDALMQLSEEELYRLPVDPSVRRKTWPLSLQAFFKCIDRFQLANIVPSLQSVFKSKGLKLTQEWPEELVARINRSCAMNPKKFHEVDILCPLLEQIGRAVGCKRVIDLGCGQGYLCNILALCCDVEVLGIDSVASQVAGAERKLKNIQKDIGLMMRKGVNLDAFMSLEPTVKYVQKPISCSMTATDLFEAIEESGDTKSGGVLVGLHTCGDLAASMLRMFNASPQVDAVLNVGCCYNLMTVATEENPEVASITNTTSGTGSHLPSQPGYPMSKLCSLALPSLERDTRSLACQSVERRHFTQAKMDRVHKSHSYRAVFQYILEKELALYGRLYAGAMSQGYYDSFVVYSRELSNRFQLPPEQHLSEEKLNYYWDTIGVPWHKQICAFDSIRTALAPVIESLILLDRVAYMRECGHDATLVALFDPAISPRFVGILATKPKNSIAVKDSGGFDRLSLQLQSQQSD